MQYVIYADVLWLVNFMMDFMLLWCTRHFAGFSAAWYRLLLAAALGGFYGLGMVFPTWSFLYWPGIKLLFPVVLLVLAFGRLGWRRLGKGFLYFYLLSFALSGAVLGGSALLCRYSWLGEQPQPIHMMTLLFGVFLAMVLARYGWCFVKENLQKETHLVQGELMLAGQTITLWCMLDTGNALQEPISGTPVMVVSYEAVKKLLPKTFCSLYERQAGSALGAAGVVSRFLLQNSQSSFACRLALLPFSTVGMEQGTLLGIRPDRVRLGSPENKGWIERNNVVLGLYQGRLSNSFQAIVNPSVLLHQGEKEQTRKKN